MKSLVLALSLLALPTFATAASMGRKILVCELSFGPVAEVTIRSTLNGLVIEELRNTGSFNSRPLTDEEWTNRVIKLQVNRPEDAGTLTYKGGEWSYAQAETFFGLADCTTGAR